MKPVPYMSVHAREYGQTRQRLHLPSQRRKKTAIQKRAALIFPARSLRAPKFRRLIDELSMVPLRADGLKWLELRAFREGCAALMLPG